MNSFITPDCTHSLPLFYAGSWVTSTQALIHTCLSAISTLSLMLTARMLIPFLQATGSMARAFADHCCMAIGVQKAWRTQGCCLIKLQQRAVPGTSLLQVD